MDWFMVAIAVLLVAVVISRFVAEAGLKCLSVEQKGELVEAFSGFRSMVSSCGLASPFSRTKCLGL